MKFCQYDAWFIVMVFFFTYSSFCNGAMFGATHYAVTKFKDLPQYYRQLLKAQNSTQQTSNLKTKDKNRLCKEIFKTVEVNPPIDPSRANQEKFEHDHPELLDLFERRCPLLYRIQKKECAQRDITYHYVNASKPITVSIDGDEYGEEAFVCLFPTGNGNHLRRYYVSDYAYNVNDSPRASKISGRFVFYDGKVFALAEVLPRVSRSRNADPVTQLTLAEHYWNKRTAYSRQKATVSDEKTDPICQLDDGRKLRLCTYVAMLDFNVTALEWEQDPISVRQDGESSCDKKTFSFTDGSQFDEWMVICDYHKSPELGQSVRVSRGYKDNSAFVSALEAKERLDLIYFLEGVSVVVDSKYIDNKNIRRA